MKRKGAFWVHLSICLHPASPSPSPSPPPLLPEPVAKSEKEKGERERERDLATSEPSFSHPPLTFGDVGHPGALAMGEVLRHRGGVGAAGRRQPAATEPGLGGAGVDFPAPG